MRAAFEAFALVLLAGGSERAFVRADQEMVAEDFRSLKRVFCTCGEGLVAEEVVDREAEAMEGIVGLMGMLMERLVEDFSIAACEMVGTAAAEGQRVPLPATTGRWSRADPNTLLRVLCHRRIMGCEQINPMEFHFLILASFLLLLLYPCTTRAATEAEALLQWKSSLNQPTSLSSWSFSNSTTTTVCNWSGISCNPSGSVVGLTLPRSGLNGTLDDLDFSSLPNLATINLNDNLLAGAIPSNISSLSKLTWTWAATHSFLLNRKAFS